MGLKIFLLIYLILGFIYAVYIAIKKTDRWFWFPVNCIFGPITVVFLIYVTIKGKKLPTDW